LRAARHEADGKELPATRALAAPGGLTVDYAAAAATSGTSAIA
jgi:hypothetical protein